MVELQGWILPVWTCITMLLAAGSAWGAMKYQQKALTRELADIKQDVRAVEARINVDETEFIRRRACESIRHDCGKLRDYQETNTCRKLSEVKKVIDDLARKQDATSRSTDEAFRQIFSDLAAFKNKD